MQTAADNADIGDADKEALTAKRNALYNGDPNSAISPNPAFGIIEVPFRGGKNGAYSRYKSRKARAQASANYNEQIGESMSYENPKSDASLSTTAKPTLTALAAAIAYLISMVVGNRGESGMWEAQMRRKGEETWQTIKNGTGKSADAVIMPSTPGQPEQVELRILLYKNNQIYGQPSDSVYVTINP